MEQGSTPNRETNPVEGLKPYIELNEAGQLIEPMVSVPIDTGLNPADTDTAEPLEEPHGCCGKDNFSL